MSHQENDERGSGVLKFLGIGCLVIILIIGLGGVILWKVFQASGGLEGMIQKGGGKAIELVVTETTSVMLQEMKIPEADREAILSSFEGLGDRIAEGDIDPEKVEQFVESLADGPLIGVLLAEGFAHSYLPGSDLNADQFGEAQLTINRFQQGLINGTIETDELSELESHVLTEVSDNSYKLKNSLSDSDLLACLEIMKKSADDASIPMTSATIDLPGMIQEAIESALHK